LVKELIRTLNLDIALTQDISIGVVGVSFLEGACPWVGEACASLVVPSSLVEEDLSCLVGSYPGVVPSLGVGSFLASAPFLEEVVSSYPCCLVRQRPSLDQQDQQVPIDPWV